MALVSYQDIYEHSERDDDIYRANLAKQVEDIVTIESDCYEVRDMEHIVDCVNCIRDILSFDDGIFVREQDAEQGLDYLICPINYNNFMDNELEELRSWHDQMRHIIEN
tara:strand:+ start:2400 stop:2726 length:327 start_codon:yes stop_codon:yes gene_type:complete